MNIIIYCENTDDKRHDFYIISGMNKYYLLSQRYSKSVQERFNQGVLLNKTQINSRDKRNYKIMKTMEKIYKQIRYLEVENGIPLLDRTQRRTQRGHSNKLAS